MKKMIGLFGLLAATSLMADVLPPPAALCKCPPGQVVRSGKCTAVLQPTICPHIAAPVCGCDGVTYGNYCHAQAAGVLKYTSGRCISRE